MKHLTLVVLLGSSTLVAQSPPPSTRAAFLKMIDSPRVDPAPIASGKAPPRPSARTAPWAATEKFALKILPNVGHEQTPEYENAMIEWFARWLKL